MTPAEEPPDLTWIFLVMVVVAVFLMVTMYVSYAVNMARWEKARATAMSKPTFPPDEACPPTVLPTNTVGNLPGQRPPVPPPGSPYAQQPQFVEQRPQLGQAAAIGAAYPAEPVQPIGSPYAPPVQLVAGTFPRVPSQASATAVDVGANQGFNAAVPTGVAVLEPSLTSSADALVEFPAMPVAADIGPPRPVGRRRRRRGVAPNANTTDWVFCLAMTLLLLLTVLAALAYLSYKKLLAMKRRGPRHYRSR
ncbi:hypothetical protein HPB51_025171 [Rhipicephalus microplus]|uniref:Uncharacterized protein n=1 Tax=Rhipicephalus microplus TaxID=6941 RepID=A0A9J6E485_RHIMP|nr:hypothetical protein HPB51_025171 [Rhipicephalus microplus]